LFESSSRLLSLQEFYSVSAHNAFLRELGLLELDFTKIELVVNICKEEIAQYVKLEDDIEKQIERAQEEIHTLQKRLAEERLVRHRKEACEALATKVNAEIPRITTEGEISEVDSELRSLKEKQKQVGEAFDLRKRQFQLLIHSIAELNQVLMEP